jgi:hypothetical protein
VPKGPKRGFFEKYEEIVWENFSRMGNGILRVVLSNEYLVLRFDPSLFEN